MLKRVEISDGRYYEYRFRYDTGYFFIDTTVSIPLSIPILYTMKSVNAYFYLCYKQEVLRQLNVYNNQIF